jgi:hypothetical protein
MTDLTGRTVAIIATDFFEEAELVQPRDELEKAGAEVRIYSIGGEPIQAVEGDTEPTQKVEVDGTLDDVDVDAIDALVVPGGTVNADKMRVDKTRTGPGPEGHPGGQTARGDLPRSVAAGLGRPGRGTPTDQL